MISELVHFDLDEGGFFTKKSGKELMVRKVTFTLKREKTLEVHRDFPTETRDLITRLKKAEQEREFVTCTDICIKLIDIFNDTADYDKIIRFSKKYFEYSEKLKKRGYHNITAELRFWLYL